MDKRIIIAIVGAMGVILAGIAVLGWIALSGPRVPVYESDTFTEAESDFDGPAIDSGARIELEKLRQQVEAMSERIEGLERDISELRSRPMPSAPPPAGQQQEGSAAFRRDGPNKIIDSYPQVVLIAARRTLNQGVRIATPSYLASIFGKPREDLTQDCQSMTNQRLKDKLVTEEVGPIRVTMLQPAIDSLRNVFAKIEATDPDLYARINTAGSLCVRLIRGSSSSISTHAFGLSLDLNIDGKLDTLGDGRTQLGLTILADFFRNEGWYWGAGFGREDSMHFEASRDLVERWIEEGKL